MVLSFMSRNKAAAVMLPPELATTRSKFFSTWEPGASSPYNFCSVITWMIAQDPPPSSGKNIVHHDLPSDVVAVCA